MVATLGRSLLFIRSILCILGCLFLLNAIIITARITVSCAWTELNYFSYSYFPNLVSETMPNNAVKVSNVVLASRLFTFPNLLCL